MARSSSGASADVSATAPWRMGPVDTSRSPQAVLRALPHGGVRVSAGFWARMQAINRQVSLRHGFRMLEAAGNLHNLRLAAGLAEGSYRGRVFQDSDVYKWLEAVGWDLGRAPDSELAVLADQAIALVVAAQRPDGYLNSHYQVVEPDARLTDLDHGHELYCAGHLFQAAVAFHRALGDDRLLKVSRGFADYLASVFGPGRRSGTCGHPEIEMALIELYRTTGEDRYLELSRFFLDQRGRQIMSGLGPYGPEYHQDHLPVREAVEAVGHTVRQLYLAAGVTDLYLETGDRALLEAMRRLWEDITARKLYVTGGLGSRFDGEAFGDPYELPPDQCYCEACSAIAHFMWNWRLLLASGDGRYADQMERTLYNSILASPSLDGQHYFYVNPLMLREARFLRLSSNPPSGDGTVPAGRPEWHEVACCPPNVMRLIASLSHYAATADAHGVQIHHYAAADVEWQTAPGERVELRLETDYPWEGQVRVTVTAAGERPWALSLRVPEWSRNATLTVNGGLGEPPPARNGYMVLQRTWREGDVVDLNFGMAPVLLASNPRVDATRDCLAIQRGPLVYCLEDRDQEIRGRLLDLGIDPAQPLGARWDGDLLGGVVVVEAHGRVSDAAGWEGRLYRPVPSSSDASEPLAPPPRRPLRLVAIPYFAWGNRGIGPMRVWIPRA